MKRKRWLTIICIAVSVASLLVVDTGARADDKRPSPLAGLTGSATPAARPHLDLEAKLRRVTAAAEAASALGAYYDRARSQFVVVAPATGAGRTLTAGAFRGLAVPLRVVRSRLTRQTVDAVTGDIAERAWHPDAGKYSYASYVDIERGVTVLDSDAPDDVVAALLDRHPGAIDYQRAAVHRDTRYVDPIPHWGGTALATLAALKGSPNPPVGCTSSFPVRAHNTHSMPGFDLTVDYMLTAGHCAALGEELWTYNVPNPNGSGFLGLVVWRAPYPTFDMELMVNLSLFDNAWEGAFYVGGGTEDNAVYVGPTSTAADPVTGATGYCYSGAVSFQNCDLKVYSTRSQLCTPAGCTPNLMAYRPADLSAPLPARPGDSGAPVYQYGECEFQGSFYPCAHIRGIHMGSSGRMMLAAKWSTIASAPFRNSYPEDRWDFVTVKSVFGP